ncbi:PIR protein [Plasmodium vivax]|uniref:VIR protein n=1 Tax=Plasmodium vivax TaxID=5855 RepID=A0A565A3X2_PLAVI|nr:PIR protein [Plasmodium vivax]
MRKNIYNFASNFEKYQTILDTSIEEVSSGGSSVNCYIDKDSLQKYTHNFTEETCKKATYYLNEIEKKTNDPQYIEDGCKYFCYWLQVEVLEKEKPSYEILKLYQDLLNEYDRFVYTDILPKYINTISEHTIKNFIGLVDMYKKFHNFKNSTETETNKCNLGKECVLVYEKNIEVCKAGNDYDLCCELDNFRDEYNKYIKENIQCNDLLKILRSYRTYDPVVITSIPCVIILVACFFFFLYKFSPLGSCFSDRIKNKKRISKNIDYETQNLSHISKGTYKNKNRQYNIAYISS